MALRFAYGGAFRSNSFCAPRPLPSWRQLTTKLNGGGGNNISSFQAPRPSLSCRRPATRLMNGGGGNSNASSPKESSLTASIPTMHRMYQMAKSDPGNIVMNVGSILALSGFMMSDVMHLRVLSICGSACGITFNLTRRPPQYNACLWGLVFVSVNVYHLYYLYLERNEDMTFNHDEMLLYSCQFKQWGVEPWQFKKLVRLDGCRFRAYKRGDVVLNADTKLDDVLMVVRGEVGAESPDQPPLAVKPMYTYQGEGQHGCVIGGTALVDPNVRNKRYPNRLVCEADDTVVVKWDTDELSTVMQKDKDVESAILHSLYTELIQGLRRDRKNRKEEDWADRMSSRLVEFERLIDRTLKNASAENGYLKLKPADKREVREYARDNGVTLAQQESLIWKHKWTMDEWHDGAKEMTAGSKEGTA